MTALRTLLGDYAHTRALFDGRVSDPGIKFEFAQFSGRLPFKSFVRDGKFDIGELPLIPLLQARELGKPFVLMPVVLLAQFQHRSVYVRADSAITKPRDLNGRRIGIRSDAQTGPVWTLGILANEYGVDIGSFRVLIFEDPHIAEYIAPPNVSRAEPGQELVQTLIDGEVDAIVGDVDLTRDERLRPLLPDYAEHARLWYGRTGIVPAGHVLVVSSELSKRNPEAIRKIFHLFYKSKMLAPRNGEEIDAWPLGTMALRPILEIMIDYAVQQKLIKRRLSPDELYDETTRALIYPDSQ